MKIRISYQEALAEFPKQVEEVLFKLRNGKSIHKDTDPASLDWTYRWAVTIYASGSLLNLIMDKSNHYVVPAGTPSVVASLHAKKGRWWGGVGPLDPLPGKVKAAYSVYCLAGL